MFKDKYEMTVDENVFVAKRNIVDYIWKSANLEGLAVTYPDTLSVYNGLSVKGLRVDEIIAINNLKRSWSFILEHLDYETDYPFICNINKIVGGDDLINRAGFIRKVPVRIGGTSWQPDMPIENQIKEELEGLSKIEETTNRAMEIMLYIMRKQIFIDGNKRTSMLAANHLMISNGAGIISIPIEVQPRFTELLVKYYETGNMDEVKDFIYYECIDGIDFREQDRKTSDKSLEPDQFKLNKKNLER